MSATVRALEDAGDRVSRYLRLQLLVNVTLICLTGTRSATAGESASGLHNSLRLTRDDRVLRGHDLPLPCAF